MISESFFNKLKEEYAEEFKNSDVNTPKDFEKFQLKPNKEDRKAELIGIVSGECIPSGECLPLIIVE